MQQETNITEDEFVTKYTPIKNHLDNSASHDGCMFETYGEELEYINSIRNTEPKRVFTIIDNNDGWTGICAGYHWVNRVGYLITEEEWRDENEEYTIYDNTLLREEWESLPVEAIEEIVGIEMTGSMSDEEEIRDENFYLWEEMSKEERNIILNKYKTEDNDNNN